MRKTIYNFFICDDYGALDNEGLMKTLKWLMFEQWNKNVEQIKLDFCPYEDCDNDKVVFEANGDTMIKCRKCGREVYLTDYFRFHEIISEPNGASGIFGYLTSLIEQILVVQIIKFFYENSKQKLSEIIFIKDGPLAFFAQTFRLHKPMRKLIKHLFKVGEKGESLINLVGLEKSGPFVEHAFYIQEKLKENHFYILTDEYIKKYIAMQNNTYGHNTYYGWKVIYKTIQGDVLVASIPVYHYPEQEYSESYYKKENFSNIETVLSVLSKMRCNMYENSLIPIALINKLVSISEFPSSKILEKFIKDEVGK